MIKLEIDLSYLSKHYEVGAQKLQNHGGSVKSIDEIMQAEAAEGNSKAGNFRMDVLNDPTELVKLFKLSNTENRYKILSNMNYLDLKYLMNSLEKEDLALGLKFFTKDKLLSIIKDLPKDKLLAVIKEIYSSENLIKLFPESELNKFFDSTKVNKQSMWNEITKLSPETLAKFIESVTGQPCKGKTGKQMLETIDKFSPQNFKDGLKGLDLADKQNMIGTMVKNNSDLMKEFSSDTLANPMKYLDKSEITKSMEKLEDADLIKIMGELPEDLLAIVASQIDPMVFADILVKQYKDVLSQLSFM